MEFGAHRKTSQFCSEIEAFYCTDYYTGVYFDINRLKHYLYDIDNHIFSINKKIITNLNNEEPDIKLSMLKQPHFDNSLNHFSDLLRKNTLITIYSHLESKLFDLTILIKYHFPEKQSFVDYCKDKKNKKSKVKEILKYLEEEMCIANILKEYYILDDYRLIRDCIIHCNSTPLNSNKKEEIERIIKKTSELYLQNNIFIINSNEYIYRFADIVIGLFKEITSKLCGIDS